jgi:G6PDH family F420-dependent oxidoreductase
MLEEAVAVIRALWTGELIEHRGSHYTVGNARLYTRPDAPPPIMVAAAGREAAELAGRIGDGFVGTAPAGELLDAFRSGGGADKPCFGQVTVSCYARDEREARRTAHMWWPNAGLSGELGQVLPQPAHFEAAAENVSPEDIAELIVCGPDADRHVEFIERFAEAGYSHVYVHQVGPDQAGFFRFYQTEVLPRIASRTRPPIEALARVSS